MRPLLFCLLPILAACAGEAPPTSFDPVLVADRAMPDISVEGEAATFALRPGLNVPEARDMARNGKVFSFRWLESGGEFPYPPPPPDPDMAFPAPELIYPNIALVGGTEDPREAFIVKEIACGGGYDPTTGYSISMPPRYAPTGEWVFEISARCDG
jgi:hypothetical protein